MKLSGYVPIIFACLMGCTGNDQKTAEGFPYKQDTPLLHITKDSTLVSDALDRGDFSAFNKLNGMLFQKGDYPMIFLCSTIMANRHECPEAYYELYRLYSSNLIIDFVRIDTKDSVSKNLSYYYLFKSYELDFSLSESTIKSIFGADYSKYSSEYFWERAKKRETE